MGKRSGIGMRKATRMRLTGGMGDVERERGWT